MHQTDCRETLFMTRHGLSGPVLGSAQQALGLGHLPSTQKNMYGHLSDLTHVAGSSTSSDFFFIPFLLLLLLFVPPPAFLPSLLFYFCTFFCPPVVFCFFFILYLFFTFSFCVAFRPSTLTNTFQIFNVSHCEVQWQIN